MELENKYNIKGIIEELEQIINDLFLSGLGIVYENTMEDMKNLVEKCRDIGLTFAGEKLEDMMKELSKKEHSVSFDYSKVVKDYHALSGYVDIVISKIEDLG
ncbi:hypothetical protein [Crassaminicella profunda]|uniref:hypothetical protein n=1 Tax=Crassaminicella profunda TaxID=1286698 RepID=UPI001CA60367|nr:hypothetical protein [Crassaminicella profunda]QZY56180.1 hypothetical protein K7H06_04085 [Crassaminicella profunda]